VVADAFTILTIFGLERPLPCEFSDAPLTASLLVLVLVLVVEVAVVVVELPFGEVADRFPELVELAGPPESVEPGPEGLEVPGDEVPPPEPPPEPADVVGEVDVVVVGELPTGALLMARTSAGENDG
jgi:hypothetical protein